MTITITRNNIPAFNGFAGFVFGFRTWNLGVQHTCRSFIPGGFGVSYWSND